MNYIEDPIYSDEIPPLVLQSLVNYRDHHLPPGGFVRAVLANDLVGAYQHADAWSVQTMVYIVSYVYNCFPSRSSGMWGSYEAVDAWLAKAGEAE